MNEKEIRQLCELFSKLIKLGWKPYGYDSDSLFCDYKFGGFRFIRETGEIIAQCSLRGLVSHDSGFREFVCEKGFIKSEGESEHARILQVNDTLTDDLNLERKKFSKLRGFGYYSSPFWLVESALLPDSVLRYFILDNVKVEGIEK